MCLNKRLVEDYEREVNLAVSELGEEPKDPVRWRTWYIDRHLPVVMSLARKFYRQAPAHVAFLDMVQIGNLGLIKEVDQFISAGRKGTFSPGKRIKANIIGFLRREKNHTPQPQPQLSLFA